MFVKLTKEQEEHRARILQAHMNLVTLKQECEHVPADVFGVTRCAICNTKLGITCEASPTGMCEYDLDSDEFLKCIHCGKTLE